jgi:hypothetical protein
MRPIAFVLAGLIGLSVTTAFARDYRLGSLEIIDPWSRATPKGPAWLPAT